MKQLFGEVFISIKKRVESCDLEFIGDLRLRDHHRLRVRHHRLRH